MVEIVCAHCSAPYTAQRTSRKYCSALCMGRALSKTRVRVSRRLPVLTKTCAHCEAPFDTTRPKQKFCSHKCAGKNVRETHRTVLNERAKIYMRARRMAHPEVVRKAHTKHREKPESRLHAAAKSRDWHATNHQYANPRRQMRKQKERNIQPWHTIVKGAQARSKVKNIPCDLTPEWARARWTGRCELTGLPFEIGLRGSGGKLFSPSVDKIIPALGYTQSNCRFILHCVNIFKYTGTDEQMYAVANALLANRASPASDMLSLPG